MSKIHDGAKESPLPSTVEEAWAAILALRSLLIREREQHVKLVERRELDARAARGTIAALRKELEKLKGSV